MQSCWKNRQKKNAENSGPGFYLMCRSSKGQSATQGGLKTRPEPPSPFTKTGGAIDHGTPWMWKPFSASESQEVPLLPCNLRAAQMAE